jgi:hypothetical protein
MLPIYKAICLHIILSMLFLYIKPDFFFNKDETPKTFGIGTNSTPFTYYIVTTVISSITFLLWSIFPSIV